MKNPRAFDTKIELIGRKELILTYAPFIRTKLSYLGCLCDKNNVIIGTRMNIVFQDGKVDSYEIPNIQGPNDKAKVVDNMFTQTKVTEYYAPNDISVIKGVLAECRIKQNILETFSIYQVNSLL